MNNRAIKHLEEKYQSAIEQAIEWIHANYRPLGIIASGSIIRGNPHANSDLDICVIHDQPFRQRIQKFFNAAPCEIFINNPTQIQVYFETELKKNRPVTANLLSTGKIYFGQDNPVVNELVSKAHVYAAKGCDFSKEKFLSSKYMIATAFEDATDLMATDRQTCHYLLNKVVSDSVELVFKIHQRPLPRVKERFTALLILEPAVGELVLKYYDTHDAGSKYDLAKELTLALTGKTGFFEWSTSLDTA